MEAKDAGAPQSNVKQPPPAGLRSIISECMRIYPDQPNPLQVTTLIKYWLGGQDPLDYISMYHNPGNEDLRIPPHWHYVTFGLSDLHGDGRVYPVLPPEPERRSGMGFELTFRLIKRSDKSAQQKDLPPVWPANLLQMLARYVLQTGNRLCVGDNVPWKKSLDGTESSIQHLLIAKDPQLKRLQTPFGWVDFCQVVGVTEEELDQATWWNGNGVLNLLKKDAQTGGAWHITDMSRTKSVFELFPETLEQLIENLETEGSDLAGINAEFSFKEIPKVKLKQELPAQSQRVDTKNGLSTHENNANNETKDNEAITINDDEQKLCASMMSVGTNSVEMQSLSNLDIPLKVIPLEGLELTIAPQFAKYLLLAIRDRLRHGRHFTLKSECTAITFVSESVSGTVVTKTMPYALQSFWLQVLIPNELVPFMIKKLESLVEYDDNPIDDGERIFEWLEYNLKIIIGNPIQEKHCLI